MFNRYIEFRETRQFRKIQAASQKRRQMFILLGIMSALLLAISGIKAVMPTEPAKSAPVVAKPVSTPQPRTDIQEFAAVVTKPLATLTPEDIEVITSKQDDPCYSSNIGIGLNQTQIVHAITKCKSLTK